MVIEGATTTAGNGAKAVKAHKCPRARRETRFGRRARGHCPGRIHRPRSSGRPRLSSSPRSSPARTRATGRDSETSEPERLRPRRQPAWRAAAAKAPDPALAPTAKEQDVPPTTRLVRPEPAKAAKTPPRTVLVRGSQQIARTAFERDPAVGFLIIVGRAGPWLVPADLRGQQHRRPLAGKPHPARFRRRCHFQRGAGLPALRFE